MSAAFRGSVKKTKKTKKKKDSSERENEIDSGVA